MGSPNFGDFNRVWFVAVDGNDATGDGSESRPFATVMQAVRSATNGDGVFIKRGTYRLPATYGNTYYSAGIIHSKAITIWGENNDTVLVWHGADSPQRDGNFCQIANANAVLCNLKVVFRPGKTDNYSNALFRWTTATIENVYFERDTANTTQWSYGYDNDKTGNPTVVNCIFNSNGRSRTDYSGSPYYINCIFDINPSRGTRNYCLTRAIRENDWNVLLPPSADTVDTGATSILDPDGTRSDIGVRGGRHSWARIEENDMTSTIKIGTKDLNSILNVYSNEWTEQYRGVEDYTLPMTSATSNGYVVSASSEYSPTNAAWKAFNHIIDDSNHRWVTNQSLTGWVQIKLDKPISISSYSVTAPNYAPEQTAPKEWILYGSNDGTEWTELHVVTEQPIWGVRERRRFDLESPSGSFLYYRWGDMQAIGGGSLTLLSIQELELLESRYYGFSQRRSYFDVPYEEYLTSSLTVNPHGIMEVKVNIAPIYRYNVPTTVEVKSVDNLTTTISIPPHGVMEAKVDVAPIYHDSIDSLILVKNVENVIATISVPPHNKMQGIVEAVPPPRTVLQLSSIKDAFVRSYVPRLNYGVEQEMLIGRGYDGEIYHSVLQFDHTLIPKEYKIVRAELKLYSDHVADTSMGISVMEILEDWTENGVTWANKPKYGREVGGAVIGRERQYVTIDLIDLVTAWQKDEAENKGLYLLPQDLGDYRRISSRERGTPFAPVIEVEYYDPVVKSVGYSEAVTTLTVRQANGSDIRVTGTVASDWGFELLPSSMKVLNQDMVETFLGITRKSILSHTKVRRADTDRVEGSLTVRGRDVNEVESELIISRNFVHSYVKVRRSGEKSLESSITVKQNEKSALESTMAVTRKFVISDISVFQFDEVEGSITVVKVEGYDVKTNLTVIRNDDSTISSSVNVWKQDEILSFITTRSGYFASSVQVPYREKTEVTSKINVSVKYASELATEVDVLQSSKIDSIIAIRQTDYSALPCSGLVRVKAANSVTTTISVVIAGAYAFIM